MIPTWKGLLAQHWGEIGFLLAVTKPIWGRLLKWNGSLMVDDRLKKYRELHTECAREGSRLTPQEIDAIGEASARASRRMAREEREAARQLRLKRGDSADPKLKRVG